MIPLKFVTSFVTSYQPEIYRLRCTPTHPHSLPHLHAYIPIRPTQYLHTSLHNSAYKQASKETQTPCFEKRPSSLTASASASDLPLVMLVSALHRIFRTSATFQPTFQPVNSWCSTTPHLYRRWLSPIGVAPVPATQRPFVSRRTRQLS